MDDRPWPPWVHGVSRHSRSRTWIESTGGSSHLPHGGHATGTTHSSKENRNDSGSGATEQDCRRDFLKFIARSRFTTPDQETANLLRIANDLFRVVARNAMDKRNSVETVVQEYGEIFAGKQRSLSMSRVNVTAVLSRCLAELTRLMSDVFREFDLTPEMEESLVQLVGKLIKSDAPTPSHSGIVIAGFGDKELFPTLIALTIEGVVGGRLKHDRGIQVDIARDGEPTTIIPFAQGEMVARFMEGTDPAFLEYLGDTMGEASDADGVRSARSIRCRVYGGTRAGRAPSCP